VRDSCEKVQKRPGDAHAAAATAHFRERDESENFLPHTLLDKMRLLRVFLPLLVRSII
jgi:hypothetical protein